MPLCVDLDGTILSSDSLFESFCQLTRAAPWLIFVAPFWLLGGRVNLKWQIAKRITINPQHWPLNAGVEAFVRQEKARGRIILLVTAADQAIAKAFQARLGQFDEVLASDRSNNLAGKAKAEALVKRFGAKGFDYIGDSTADFPVWKAARLAHVVGGSGLVALVGKMAEVGRVFDAPRPGWRDWLKALRVHQWSKNLLLLVPLMGAHECADPRKLSRVLLGMLAFSLCASSVYMVNDLLDLEPDRQHHSKRYRPFAAGKLPLAAGFGVFPLLFLVSLLLALAVGWKFAMVFGIYYRSRGLFWLYLKQGVLIEVMPLACLYGIGFFAGGVAAVVAVSDWLLMLSLYLFLRLAFVKRYTELRPLQDTADTRAKGRAYRAEDMELVSSMGLGSGYLSVLVLAMYITHPSVTVLYHHPQVLWVACVVLFYWISRVWLLAHRGAMHDDPIVFALRDRQSWLVVAIVLLLGVIAGPK